MMKVYVVVKQINQGMIAGVFVTLEKASEYITLHPYDGFIVEECQVQGMRDT